MSRMRFAAIRELRRQFLDWERGLRTGVDILGFKKLDCNFFLFFFCGKQGFLLERKQNCHRPLSKLDADDYVQVQTQIIVISRSDYV
jgi:hypothetical protein